MLPGQFLGNSNSSTCHWSLKLVRTWKSQVWEQRPVCDFSFERNYNVLKSKNSCILLNKNITFNKNETELKMENPTHSFRDMNLVVQPIWESQIKSKTVISCSSRKKKKSVFFVPFILSELNFFKICFISMHSVLNTLSEHTHFYKLKILLHKLLFLVFKIVESLECILKLNYEIS